MSYDYKKLFSFRTFYFFIYYFFSGGELGWYLILIILVIFLEKFTGQTKSVAIQSCEKCFYSMLNQLSSYRICIRIVLFYV